MAHLKRDPTILRKAAAGRGRPGRAGLAVARLLRVLASAIARTPPRLEQNELPSQQPHAEQELQVEVQDGPAALEKPVCFAWPVRNAESEAV